MDKSSSSSSTHRLLASVVVCVCLCLLTGVGTLLITRQFYADALCARTATATSTVPRLTFGKNTEWDTTHRIHIDEKGVTVMFTDGSERCYITPINRNNESRAYVLMPEPLSHEVLEELAGEHAVEFCADAPAYLLKEVNALEKSRKKRQAAAAGDGEEAAAASPAPAPAGAGGSEARKWGGDLEYEQRTPRCEDLVLDCGLDSNIGQEQGCYTWINGVLFMKQVCQEPNKFTIYMSKPPGRILKIAQREWKVCLTRRQQGLRC